MSSLHPPSKLLFFCLASTDLCVGLIVQPLYVLFIMSSEHSQRCFYVDIVLNTIGILFCEVSLLTVSAISVDRLVALLLRLRYRQVVTLKKVWVVVAVFWLFATGNAILSLYSIPVAALNDYIVLILCAATSIFCYTKIYLTLHHHQVTVADHVHEGEPLKWTTSSTEYIAIQKDCVQYDMGPDNISGLLFSMWDSGTFIFNRWNTYAIA